MKEVLGIFAAIAAVAGIASAVSKDEEKTLTEQQKLALEQERLKQEAEQRAHQQQMESQRMQMDYQRVLMERDQREYQRKLANAPKKAVYKTAASLQCPLCMGQREVNETTGTVHCPYCGASEKLTVDHFEIDQEAFRRQLQEEEQARIAAEAEQQRKHNYNTAITVFAILAAIMLIVLINSPFVGTVLFVPVFLILCFLLYKRFPEPGEKVWTVIKFPLACILLFPLPLTAFFMHSEKCQARFPKGARIGMSIGAWTLYAALICVLGGLFVNGFQKEVHSADHTPAAVTETQKPVVVQTTKATTAAAKITTTTQTKSELQIPAAAKKNIEYFDHETNAILEMGNAAIEIPSKWTRQEKYSSENGHLYYDNQDKVQVGELIVGSHDYSDEPMTENQFSQNRKDLLSEQMHTFIVFESVNSYYQEITVNGMAGIHGAAIGTLQNSEKNVEVDFHCTLFFNEKAQQLIEIDLLEFHEADSTYWNDYKKIIKSVRFTNENPETSLTQEPASTTETPSEVTETPQVVRIDVDTMEKERDENAAAAKAKYKDQYIEVVDRVGSIDSDLKYISLLSPTDDWDFISVHCSLTNDAVKETVKTLKVDQIIVVRGTITDVGEILGYDMDADEIITE